MKHLPFVLVAIVWGTASGCVGEVTGDSSPDSTESSDDPGRKPTASSAVRRLSTQELRNSIEALTGIVPRAFEQFPPDSLEFTYDRIVNSQTVSPAHLDAHIAIAEEVTTTLIGESRLDDLTVRCPDNILPPASDSKTLVVGGNALALSPDFSVTTAADPNHGRTLYAPDPTAIYAGQFEASGDYEVAFSFNSSSTVSVELLIDGVSVDSDTGLSGNETLRSGFHLDEGGSHTLQFDLQSTPNDNNLDVTYLSLEIVGPIDTGAALFDQQRQACITALIDDFAPRAFRRPLTQDQQGRLFALYESQGSYGQGLSTLLQAIFLSPHFLFVVEFGNKVSGESGLFALDSWEMATRLSYAICEEPPDAELREAAANDALQTTDDIEAHARRLFDKPCAEPTILRFFENWLWLNRLDSLNKSPEAFSDFSEDVRSGMGSETRRYLREMLFGKEADLKTLMTAEYSWPDPRSAFLYGIEGIVEQEETQLPPERRGILTQPSILAVTSLFDGTSPVKRGVFVLEQLLCTEPPPPPADLVLAPPSPDPNATTRERWAQHAKSEACAGCHSLIDPIGFAFEEFDAIGRHRTEESGRPIDAAGGLPSIGVKDGSLNGTRSLIDALVDSPELATCVSKQWLRFALGRMEQRSDDALLRELGSSFDNLSLKEALISIVVTNAFRHRSQEKPE